MTEQQKLEEFVKLAAKTGRIYVAENIYLELRKLSVAELVRVGLSRIEIIPSSFLSSGSVMAYDPEKLSKYLIPVGGWKHTFGIRGDAEDESTTEGRTG